MNDSGYSAMREAIEHYLGLLDGSELPEDCVALARTLDRLTDAYFQTEDCDPGDAADAPQIDYKELYKSAGSAFPSLGYYPAVDPGGELTRQEASVGDAIDDLADIARDLKEVLWHCENTTPQAAIWEFRFGYQTHWGVHLHQLRGFLHSSRIAAW